MGDEYSCLNVEYILVCCSSYTKQWKTHEKIQDERGIDVDVGNLESGLEIKVQGNPPSNNVTYLKDETWEDIKSKIGEINWVRRHACKNNECLPADKWTGFTKVYTAHLRTLSFDTSVHSQNLSKDVLNFWESSYEGLFVIRQETYVLHYDTTCRTIVSECDCAVFIFLGFLGEDLEGEESVIVKPEREAVKTNDIIDYVKRIEGLYGKPKVFIIQADDPSLMPDKVSPIIVRQQSLTNMTEPVKETKIPVDADRLIIKSTIPQQWSEWLPGDPGSLLFKAFCDIVVNNASRMDLLSLTTDINERVKTWIHGCQENFLKENKYGGDFFNKLKYPLCSSTLRKLLYFGMKTQDNPENIDHVSNHSESDESQSNNPVEEEQFGSTFPSS